MPSVKTCPNCNCLPNVRFNQRFVRHICLISCPNEGCSQFDPVVATGFSDNCALNKAAELWNERIEAAAQ